MVLLLNCVGAGRSGEPASAPIVIGKLDLDTCRRLALEKQPELAAGRASLASVVAGARALEQLRLASLFAPDVTVRRQQSALGVQIAQARVCQLEQEAVYSATRTYWMVVYARQQKEFLRSLEDDFGSLAPKENGAKRDADGDRIYAGIQYIHALQAEASSGERRALAALREAIGFGPECEVDIVDHKLPFPQAVVDGRQVVEMALTRRKEMQEVTMAADLFALEIKAQQALWSINARTFAQGADLHAVPIPQGVHNREYRPGAVGFEMPPMLGGRQKQRVEQATDLYKRALAVVEKTRNLIALEAEDAYLRWDEADKKAKAFLEGAEAAKQLFNKLREQVENPKITPENKVSALVLQAQLEGQANSALLDRIVGLAGLERVTAGGICVNLGAAPPP
jgi:outer membrane protein TolC